jgi:hypothetical protein
MSEPTVADKLRRIMEIAEGDPSMVGGTVTAFAPLLVEAADRLDEMKAERVRLAQALRAAYGSIQRAGQDIYANGEWWATPTDALKAMGVHDGH